MRIYCLILALLLAVGAAFASSRRSFVAIQSAVASPAAWSPTNNSDGAVLVSWWDPAYYTTNTTPILPDLSTNGFSLTNLSVAGDGTWPRIGPAFGVLNFDGNDLMDNYAYTSSQPHEIWMVLRRTSDEVDRFVTAAVASESFSDEGNDVRIEAGGTVDISGNPLVSNVWYVVQVVFDGASSAMRTNLVNIKTGNAGTSAINGFRLMNIAAADVGDVLTYGGQGSNNIPYYNATWSSNIYNYLTNKWKNLTNRWAD